MLKDWSKDVKMQKRLYEGKTQKEWFEQLSESISILNLSFNDGNIQDKHKEKEIVFYFDNNDNLLSDNKVDMLIEYKNRDRMTYDYLREEFNISDNWEEDCIAIDSESVCQLLFFMNREDILSTIKDMMNCLCK